MTKEELAFRAGFRARHGMKCVGDEHVEREAYCAWDAYRREIAEPAHCALCGQMIAYGRHCGPCGQSDYQPWGSE